MAITPEDIAVALGRTAPESATAEYNQWQMWISDALMLIGARLGDVSLLDQAKLDYVVRQAVVAHVRQPEDVTRTDVALDDGRVGKEYRTAKGRVFILDEWWDLLSPGETKSAFVIDTAGSAGSIHQPWCALHFLAVYCSCGADIAGYPLYEYGR